MNRKGVLKRLTVSLGITGVALGSIFTFYTPSEANQEQNPAKVKNVIFLIGDGMGPVYNTMYRYLKDDSNTPMMESTAFDSYLVGMQKTYPHDHEENITDSAAAATSMAGGVKTYNGAIAVDTEKQNVKTVLEQAKEQGKSTGLVVTSQVNHATPAAFGAHDESRQNYNQIADDYYDDLINDQHKVDVLLGGGTSYFEREDRDLVEAFQKDGYSYVTNRKQLLKDNHHQVLGLFAPVGMDKMIDRNASTPSLAEMTNSALDRLSKDKDGFFLMVEGSQIDWAGHDNDVVGAMSEMEDFEKAFKAAIEYAKKDKHTLVVATADHSTGGLSIGANGPYVWDPAPIKAAKRTPDYMAQEIVDGEPVRSVLNKYIDLDLAEEEIQSVETATESGEATDIDNAIEAIFNERSGTGWTTGGHTGVDVNIYAYGPGSDQFAGSLENTETAEKLFDFLRN
ncbi:alkaline phosphatase [Sediminibacillus halophilus]|uniref:Alkaline phosphatase n=1 Tax=Sediminibacillus halophilus TaxID=482461 RepID=A0A1G9PC00_9BACI|nr:alkaline phosphatase [Sediminibacillus halophilus]SDL96244.1 alkaline phosphatase [Sediminibacillus halophilus]